MARYACDECHKVFTDDSDLAFEVGRHILCSRECLEKCLTDQPVDFDAVPFDDGEEDDEDDEEDEVPPLIPMPPVTRTFVCPECGLALGGERYARLHISFNHLDGAVEPNPNNWPTPPPTWPR